MLNITLNVVLLVIRLNVCLILVHKFCKQELVIEHKLLESSFLAQAIIGIATYQSNQTLRYAGGPATHVLSTRLFPPPVF